MFSCKTTCSLSVVLMLIYHKTRRRFFWKHQSFSRLLPTVRVLQVPHQVLSLERQEWECVIEIARIS